MKKMKFLFIFNSLLITPCLFSCSSNAFINFEFEQPTEEIVFDDYGGLGESVTKEEYIKVKILSVKNINPTDWIDLLENNFVFKLETNKWNIEITHVENWKVIDEQERIFTEDIQFLDVNAYEVPPEDTVDYLKLNMYFELDNQKISSNLTANLKLIVKSPIHNKNIF